MIRKLTALTLALTASTLALAPIAAADHSPGYYHGPITVNTYVYPADVQQARETCFKSERQERGIPGDPATYRTWWSQNKGTPAQLSWSAAYDSCISRHEVPGGAFSFSYLVKTSTFVSHG